MFHDVKVITTAQETENAISAWWTESSEGGGRLAELKMHPNVRPDISHSAPKYTLSFIVMETIKIHSILCLKGLNILQRVLAPEQEKWKPCFRKDWQASKQNNTCIKKRRILPRRNAKRKTFLSHFFIFFFVMLSYGKFIRYPHEFSSRNRELYFPC